MNRIFSAFLAVLLVLGAPGTGAYRAFASVVRVPARLGAAPGSSAGMLGAGAIHSPSAGTASLLGNAGATLGPSLASLSLPEASLAAPAAALSAVSPAVALAPQVVGVVSGPRGIRKNTLVKRFANVVRRIRGKDAEKGERNQDLDALFDEADPIERTAVFLPHPGPDGGLGGHQRLVGGRVVSLGLPKLAPPSFRPGSDSASLNPGLPEIETALSKELAERVADEESGAARPSRRPFRPRLSIGKAAAFFILALVLAQLGSEAVGASLPALIQQSFGDFAGTVTKLAVFSYATGFAGRQIAPMPIRKFGLKKVFLAAHGLKLVSMGALAGLLAAGAINLPLLMGFILVNTFLGGITSTTENSTPPALVGQDNAALEKYWTREQAVRQIISIAGPIGTGALVAGFGFAPAFMVFPIATAFTLYIVWRMVNIPGHAELLEAGKKAGAVRESGPREGFFARFTKGARLIWRDPALRCAFLSFVGFYMMGQFLYVLFSPGYSLLLAGPGAEELATGISGWIIGLFNLGGLFGVLKTIRQEKSLARRMDAGEFKASEVREILRKSLLRWMLLGALSVLTLASLAVPLGPLASYVALPHALSWAGSMTLPALVLMPMGFANIVIILKVRSFIQARIPDRRDMPDAMGFLGAGSLVVQATGLLAMRYLFTGLSGLTPFIFIGLATLPLSLLYLLLRGRLDKASATAS